jgi:GAF domain-containing protein
VGQVQHKSLRRRLFDLIDFAIVRLAWVPPSVSVVAGAVAAALYVFSIDPVGAPKWQLLLPAILLSLLSGGLTVLIEIWRRDSKKGEKAEKVQLLLTMNDAIGPILDDLKKMAVTDTAGRDRILGSLIGSMGPALLLLLNVKRLRVVVWVVERREERPNRLVVRKSVGRKDVPKPFVDGDGQRGSALFAWITKGEPLFVYDVRDRKLPGWEAQGGHVYKTFFSIPLTANNELFGMLSLDAPEPGDLDPEDLPIVEVLASLLSTAFAQAKRR